MIREYHSGNRPFVYDLDYDKDNELKIGLEIEMEFENTSDDDDNDFAEYISDDLEYGFSSDNENFICEYDGSLDECGLEIVSSPLIYSPSNDSNLIWLKELLKYTNERYETYSQHNGLHVHIDRDCFMYNGKNVLGLFTTLFNLFPKEILEFSDRGTMQNLDRYSRLSNVSILDSNRSTILNFYKRLVDRDDRYVAINLTNKDTVEIRIFDGTYDYDLIKYRLNKIYDMIKFCKENYDRIVSDEINLTEISWEHFFYNRKIKPHQFNIGDYILGLFDMKEHQVIDIEQDGENILYVIKVGRKKIRVYSNGAMHGNKNLGKMFIVPTSYRNKKYINDMIAIKSLFDENDIQIDNTRDVGILKTFVLFNRLNGVYYWRAYAKSDMMSAITYGNNDIEDIINELNDLRIPYDIFADYICFLKRKECDI